MYDKKIVSKEKVDATFEGQTNQQMNCRIVYHMSLREEGGGEGGGQYTVTYVFIRWADLKCKLHTRTIWVTLPLSSYQDCRKTYFINESDEDPLRMFEKGQSATLQVNPDINCANNKASLSFQEGDRELTLQNEMSDYWGLKVTRQWTGSTRRYILKVRNTNYWFKKRKKINCMSFNIVQW